MKNTVASILDPIPDAIFILNSDGNIVYRNTAGVNLIGSEELRLEKVLSENKNLKINRLINNSNKINPLIFVETLQKKEKLVELTLVETIFEDKKARMVIMKDLSNQNQLSKELERLRFAEDSTKILANEIQKRNKTEQLLEEQFIRTQSIFESSHNTFLLTLNKRFKITLLNTHCINYFFELTQNKLQINTDFFLFFKPYFPSNELNTFKKRLSTALQGKFDQIEIPLLINNKVKWLEIFVNPILNIKSEVYEISLVAHDITDKKINEKKLVTSLQEKEVLLKEIHHRVKNNLQVISSILNLQSMYVTDKNTLEILEESRNRVRSMAIIHEHLYQTTNFSSISFTAYIRNIVSYLVSSYSMNGKQIQFLEDLDLIELSLDQAIPCGLILNELVSNSLKYAFSSTNSGLVFVGLHMKDNKVELRVEDNGCGFPNNFNILKTKTLGLQLVNTLVDQLDGELTYKSYHGIKYLITFDKIG